VANYLRVTRNSRRRVLVTSHDAGGTIPPVLALAVALVAHGHEVVILSQPSVRRRAEAAGCAFAPFTGIGDYERRKPIEEQLEIVIPVVTGRTVGDDLLAVAQEHRVDLVVVDANLAGALAAAEGSHWPSVVLLHSMYKTFVDTWFGDLWPFVEAAINETRAGYGLGPVHSWPAVFAGHDRLLSVVPSAFDAPVADVPAAMRHFGFLVPRGESSAANTTAFPAGDDPAVLVGLSTTFANQRPMLEAIIEALAGLAVRGLVTTAGMVDADELPRPANVTVAEYVEHSSVLERTDAMVTHAGLGSVANAMSFGVPVVCMPVDRDQPLNAQRVADLGAGITVMPTASPGEIARALEGVLSDTGFRDAARALRAASRAEGGADAAAAELVRMLG
jgi:UDP:flavonoid glycosyltransferase YjiC (YdhE family)